MTHAIIVAHGITSQFISDLGAFFRDMNEARKVHKAIRATEIELMKLSNKDLDDIGISRGDIYSIARKDTVIKQCMKSNPNLKGWV